MPLYSIWNKKTKTETKEFMTYSSLQEHLKKNAHLEQMVCSPAIISGQDKTLKPDQGFRDILRNMKRNAGKNNTINTY